MLSYSLDHIHLFSANPALAAAFYEKTLGARNTGKHELSDGSYFVGLDLQGTAILISPLQELMKRHPPVGSDHLGVLTPDLDASIAEMKAKGVRFKGGIDYPVPGVRVAFIEAPDNVTVELVEKPGRW